MKPAASPACDEEAASPRPTPPRQQEPQVRPREAGRQGYVVKCCHSVAITSRAHGRLLLEGPGGEKVKSKEEESPREEMVVV
ncbi:hypothetical protein E2C01_095631 [Portunus trituberculatus]|uniref:Uncharacterized protein n=1 Tax=Portunus trituberculatus TaxID=210409 RepID=A0A5B7K695_PORTR|nr:hypothetical protein [Portunus trituberculatus]